MYTSRTVRYATPAASVLLLALLLPLAGSGGAPRTEASSAVRPVPAAAGEGGPADGPPSHSGAPDSAVDHVADFYGAYIDVLYDSGRGPLSEALRRHYLTPRLRGDLARWETEHRKDGVLRAGGVPSAWRVVYNDAGLGHCWTRVTLTWERSGGQVRQTRLMVQSDLATRLISGIRDDG